MHEFQRRQRIEKFERVNYRIALALAVGAATLLLFFAGGAVLGGCTPAQEGGSASTTPVAAVQSGEVGAHVTLETPSGPVLLELGTGYAKAEGAGAEGVRVLDWGATGRLQVALSGSTHSLSLDAGGEREEEGWAHCVEGEYSSGGVTVHGAVPGLQCPTPGVQVTYGAQAEDATGE